MSSKVYKSTKTFGHNLGLSAAFRQWRADSHCAFIHGYALQVHLEFEADELDGRNWVVDFGGLKTIKHWIETTFDHKTLVAQDDPELEHFHVLHNKGIIDLVVVKDVGCERFAEMVFDHVSAWLTEQSEYAGRVRLSKVEVREHGANSAIVETK